MSNETKTCIISVVCVILGYALGILITVRSYEPAQYKDSLLEIQRQICEKQFKEYDKLNVECKAVFVPVFKNSGEK